jgi:metal-sulfur cluster biosynthetic enzyme
MSMQATATRQGVFDALGDIPEPCSIAMDAPESLASMGLIESIDIDGGQVTVTLVLTDPSCVHFVAMRRYITDALRPMPGVDSVVVRMSTIQLWTPDRMHPAAAPGPRPDDSLAVLRPGRKTLPLVR